MGFLVFPKGFKVSHDSRSLVLSDEHQHYSLLAGIVL